MASPGTADAAGISPRDLARRGLLPAALLLTLIGFGLVEPRVFSGGNLQNILVQASYPAVFAAAQTFVLLTRGFDLSLGVTVSLVSVLSGLTMVAVGQATGSVPLGLAAGALVGVAAGAAVGLVNGGCVSWLGVNPFVVTLGTWNIVLGLATTVSGGRQIFAIPAELNAWFYRDPWLGIPPPVVMAAG